MAKTIRIFQHIFTAFLLILLILVFSLAFAVGISMKSGQESLVLGSVAFTGIILVSFIVLYKKWKLDWDWPHE